MVECAGFEIRCTVLPYRGFESHPLRQTNGPAAARLLCWLSSQLCRACRSVGKAPFVDLRQRRHRALRAYRVGAPGSSGLSRGKGPGSCTAPSKLVLLSACCKGVFLPSARTTAIAHNDKRERRRESWGISNQSCKRIGCSHPVQSSSSRPTCPAWTPTTRCARRRKRTSRVSGAGWRANTSAGTSPLRRSSTSRTLPSTSGSPTVS